MSSDYCPTCGGYCAGKPLVEMRRDPTIRSWLVFISATRHNIERGMVITVRDDGGWDVGVARVLTEGVSM